MYKSKRNVIRILGLILYYKKGTDVGREVVFISVPNFQESMLGLRNCHITPIENEEVDSGTKRHSRE